MGGSSYKCSHCGKWFLQRGALRSHIASKHRENLRVGDRVAALPDTTAAIFSEGRIGKIAELRDPRAYSGNDSKNLVRWGEETILMGFSPEDVRKVDEKTPSA